MFIEGIMDAEVYIEILVYIANAKQPFPRRFVYILVKHSDLVIPKDVRLHSDS